MYIPKRHHPQSLRLCISLTANVFNRLKDRIFAKNHQFLKTVDLLRGHIYTLTPYLYTLTSNLNPNFFKLTTTLIPTTIALIEKEWAAMASKYGYGIDADKVSKDKLVKFIQMIIYLCKT